MYKETECVEQVYRRINSIKRCWFLAEFPVYISILNTLSFRVSSFPFPEHNSRLIMPNAVFHFRITENSIVLFL